MRTMKVLLGLAFLAIAALVIIPQVSSARTGRNNVRRNGNNGRGNSNNGRRNGNNGEGGGRGGGRGKGHGKGGSGRLVPDSNVVFSILFL